MKHWVFSGVGGILLGLIIGFVGARMTLDRSPGFTEVMPKNTPHDVQAGQSGKTSIVQLTPEQIREFGIEVGQVGPATLQTQKVFSGEIVLNPDRVTRIVPRVSGIVIQINKTLGDPVNEGEVMAVIDSRELADAKAGYLAAIERSSLAQASFDREKTLWDKKVSSEADYLNARQTLAEAGIALRNARQTLYSLGFDQDTLAKLPDLPDASYTRYEIRAPFAGTVIDKQVGLGEVVTDASQIYQVADLSTVWAEFTVYQKDLGTLHKGQTAVIHADNIDINTTGAVEYISPMIEESTRTTVARVVISNSLQTWRPGTFVTGQVVVSEVDVPVAVTHAALQKVEGQDVVFLQEDEGFEPQVVQLGRTDPASAEILSGLKPGQHYVCTNSFTLKAELSKSTFAGGDD